MTSKKEEIIVSGLIEGSHKDFKYIYNQYSPAVYANIRKLIKPANIAEDILQDVFTALWTNRSKIDPSQPISNWLFVVSYNKSVSYLKKEIAKNVDPITEINDLNIPDEVAVDEADYVEQVVMLESAIGNLPHHKQRVFRLYHFENKSCEEIAAELDLSVSSVKFYLKQSKSLVRQYAVSGLSRSLSISILLFIFW